MLRIVVEVEKRELEMEVVGWGIGRGGENGDVGGGGRVEI